MKKRNGQIVSFILAIAIMAFSLAGFNPVNTKTTYAYADMIMQTIDVDCEDGVQDCAQEHTEDCSSCVTSHNSCHSNDYLVSNCQLDFLNSQNLLSSLDNDSYSNLNYPPDTPPV